MNNQDQGQQKIGKKLDLTNPEDFPEYIWLFIYLFNKKKFEKLLKKKKMGPQNQSIGRCTKGIKYKSICNNYQEKRSLKQMVGQTTLDRTNHEIKFTIYSTMLLHFKEG